MPTNIRFEATRVCGDGGEREGRLAYVRGVLVAVLSRLTPEDLADETNGELWFVEAGFGKWGIISTPPHEPFESLEEAAAWIADIDSGGE